MEVTTSADLAQLTAEVAANGLRRAAESPRHRHPKILHAPGDELNRVFNFMMRDSYMQPHHHPGPEKIEHIRVVEGSLAVLFFDDAGNVEQIFHLAKGAVEHVAVPAYTWHTYVMLSDHVITYETMMGQYEPASWKEMASWAPPENSPESARYLATLKAAAA